jgi:putative transposase
VRQNALDAQYELHPERFPNGSPKAALPPAEVHINPLETLAVSVTVNAPPIADTPPASRSQMASRATASTPRHETPRSATAALPS